MSQKASLRSGFGIEGSMPVGWNVYKVYLQTRAKTVCDAFDSWLRMWFKISHGMFRRLGGLLELLVRSLCRERGDIVAIISATVCKDVIIR